MRIFVLLEVFMLLLHALVSALNSDGVALLSFMSHWTFVPPSINSTWSSSHSNPCSSWVGIHCDHHHHVVSLNLSGYNIPGQLGPELSTCTFLQSLDLTSNNFSGQIPEPFKNLHKLKYLSLSSNYLSGQVPHFFTQITQLEFFDLSYNSLSGYIPTSIGNMTHLLQLFLQGLIPPELGNLVNIRTLDLSHNNLEGPLPSHLSNCTKMDKFDVGFNFLSGLLPSSLRSWKGLSSLNLKENRFSGGIPDFLSEFERLYELQLGGNMLGGRIPGSIGALQNLIYGLNLSSNGLIGDIPVEIGNLKSLLLLDLSQNNLTGSIEALDDLHSLVEINISYNSFHGPVPNMLMKLLNSPMTSFMGNPGLCINCSPPNGSVCNENSYLKQCDNKPVNHKGLGKFEIAMIVLGTSIFVVLVLLVLVYMFVFRRKSKQEVNISAREGTSSLFTKVMEATANLNDRYVIGRGAHGVVYKAAIRPDKVYAVKKLGFAASRGKNLSMVREIQTLGKIRHRNLVKLEEFWFKKDYGLILYSYMPNGSLHDVLHEKNPPQSLEWNVRYKIAVGIANGLAYLHYDCDPSIVHRDIKPNNILLDSDMEPHIADFGIAKLLDQSSTSSNPSMLVPGTIGYIAPENAYTTANSRESDVYSYGVVLLELITRKKAASESFTEEGSTIVVWVRSMWEETRGEIHEIVDSSLAQECLDTHIMEQVTQVLMVALRCTEKDPHNRPTMRDVIKQLSYANLRPASIKS
ncbi:putative protein kinase RLK-Pelle-LRR-XI-1 family [Lupinus albus]|uniref:non-specific serine/threonine protein kinase n=1 Tax=Lupinus albus TaxID=3870 RepID=A0A6A4N5X5_LUPAL|nr:putative protein kinase RLK-Pelle-LRR-XI-1 family [Lupinus albus]